MVSIESLDSWQQTDLKTIFIFHTESFLTEIFELIYSTHKNINIFYHQ